MSASARAWLIGIVGLTVVGGCSRDPVDKHLVGTWQTAVVSPAGVYQLRFTTLSNGQYRTDFQGAAPPLPVEAGYFAASGGDWRLDKLAGGADEGTYELVTADALLLKSKSGAAVLWTRIPNDVAATTATATEVAASETFAPATNAAVASVAAPSSADLLAAGPFGEPLAATAAGAATMSAPGGALPTFSPASASPPFTIPQTGGGFGGAAGSTRPPFGAAAGNASQSTQSGFPSNANPPIDTPADIPAAARQQAAKVAGEVEGAVVPAAEAASDAADEASHKIGQRIQHATGTATSKVRNFFTRGKHKNDDQNGAAEPEQDH